MTIRKFLHFSVLISSKPSHIILSEKKKTEKNLLASQQNQSTNQSFHPRSEIEQSRHTMINEDLAESSINESRRVPQLDESKSIKNFFASSTHNFLTKSLLISIDLQKTEHLEEKTSKNPQSRTKNLKSAKYRKGSPGKPNQFSKLNDREKDEKYLDLYDENLHLKKKEDNLNTQIKQ